MSGWILTFIEEEFASKYVLETKLAAFADIGCEV